METPPLIKVYVKRENHILRQNKLEHKMLTYKCNNCGTIFGVKETDVKTKSDYFKCNLVNCPTCDGPVYLKSDKFYTKREKIKKVCVELGVLGFFGLFMCILMLTGLILSVICGH